MLAAIFVFSTIAGCSKKEALDWQAEPSAPAEQPVAPDRLNDDELLEGEVKLFEFTLPRKMKLTSRFAHSGKAEGFVSLSALNRYVGKRIKSKQVELFQERTLIKQAVLKSAPNKRYLIELKKNQGKTQITLRDQTPIRVEAGLTEEERLKEAGFLRDGSFDPAQQLE